MSIELVPPQSVENEENRPFGARSRIREPRRTRAGPTEQKSWNDTGQIGARIVGNDRLGHPISSPQRVVPVRASRDTYDDPVRVSTRGDYACRALLSLALHDSDAGPISVRDIAERTALPQPYLEQILLALKGAGLVKSKRGVGGGYTLARAPRDIRLSEIISAVDGPIVLGDFGEPHQDGSCDHEGQCVLLAIWKQAGEHMRHHLEGFTLESIAAAATGVGPWPEPPHH